MPRHELLLDACERIQSVLQGAIDGVRELEEDAQEQSQSIAQLARPPCAVSSALGEVAWFFQSLSLWLTLFFVVDP